MNPSLMIVIIGLAYVLLAGGLALFRREGLSMRFAMESAIVTALVGGLSALADVPTSPVGFLILLYLVTMRVRLLVDLGSVFARQGKYKPAGMLYTIAARLWPDPASELVLKVNEATMLLQENKLDGAITMFNEVLQQAGQGYLGVKYEAASHFNLGVAYQRKNMPGRATVEFNAVIDTWPTSLFAHRAQQALDHQRSRNSGSPDNVSGE